MDFRKLVFAAAAMGLLGCEQATMTETSSAVASPSGDDEKIIQAVSGKTLVSGSSFFSIQPDGTMTGEAGGDRASGTWDVVDGKWCRTLLEPERVKGSDCLPISLDGNTVHIARKDGSVGVFEIQ